MTDVFIKGIIDRLREDRTGLIVGLLQAAEAEGIDCFRIRTVELLETKLGPRSRGKTFSHGAKLGARRLLEYLADLHYVKGWVVTGYQSEIEKTFIATFRRVEEPGEFTEKPEPTPILSPAPNPTL